MPEPDEPHVPPGGAPDGTATPGAEPVAAGPEPVAAGPEPAHKSHKSWWRRREVRITFTVLVLIFVFEYLLLPEIADARKDANLLGRVDIWWLLLAVVLEMLALAAYAQLSYTVLSPGAPSRWRLFRVNTSTLAVSHVVPGGTAAGGALGYRLLTDLQVSPPSAAYGLAVQGVGSAVVLNIIFWLALVISIPIDGFHPLYGFAALVGVLLLAAFAGTVLLLTRGDKQAANLVAKLAKRVPLVDEKRVTSLIQYVADRLKQLLQEPKVVRRAMVWAAANWFFDAASLWVFLYAFGAATSPIHLLVAYGLANVLAAIPITPGGLGVVEGVLIPSLVGFGVPRQIALLGVLTYRLVNFWLPIPMGGVAYLSLRFGPLRHRPDRARPAPS